MPNAEQLAAKAAELLKKDAVIITAVEIKHNIVNRIQVYFWSDGEAVMDIINKDDLVQNWPDSGVYTLNTNAKNCDCAFRKVEMFEGEEEHQLHLSYILKQYSFLMCSFLMGSFHFHNFSDDHHHIEKKL